MWKLTIFPSYQYAFNSGNSFGSPGWQDAKHVMTVQRGIERGR